MRWQTNGVDMNYYQAHNILDEVREGAQYSEAMINFALELTGDYGFSRLEKKDSRFLRQPCDAKRLGGIHQAPSIGDGERQIGSMGGAV